MPLLPSLVVRAKISAPVSEPHSIFGLRSRKPTPTPKWIDGEEDYFDLRNISAVDSSGGPLHLEPRAGRYMNDIILPDDAFLIPVRQKQAVLKYAKRYFIGFPGRGVRVNPNNFRGACFAEGNMYLDGWSLGLYPDSATDVAGILKAGLTPVSPTAVASLDKAFMVTGKTLSIHRARFLMEEPFLTTVMEALKARWLPWSGGLFNPEQVRHIRKGQIFFDPYTSIPLAKVPLASRQALQWCCPWYQLHRGLKINLRLAYRTVARRYGRNQIHLGCTVSFDTGHQRQILDLLDTHYRIPGYRLGGGTGGGPQGYIPPIIQDKLWDQMRAVRGEKYSKFPI